MAIMSKDAQTAMLKQLKNPFDERFVKWRVGATNSDKTKGIALAYVDSREVTKRLDEVCGLGGWQSSYKPVDNGFVCEISILIGDTWVTRSNAAGYTNVEPIKGGASDAFKRAASTWGVGRYLYYLPNIWVPIAPSGKSYALVDTPELPDWAKHDKNVENWEDVAEFELDASATFDEQDVINSVVANLDKVRGATTANELAAIVATLSTEELTALASQINLKTKELLDGSQAKPANS